MLRMRAYLFSPEIQSRLILHDCLWKHPPQREWWGTNDNNFGMRAIHRWFVLVLGSNHVKFCTIGSLWQEGMTIDIHPNKDDDDDRRFALFDERGQPSTSTPTKMTAMMMSMVGQEYYCKVSCAILHYGSSEMRKTGINLLDCLLCRIVWQHVDNFQIGVCNQLRSFGSYEVIVNCKWINEVTF